MKKTKKPKPVAKDSLPVTQHPSTSSHQIQVAVIGSGYWGRNLTRNFNQLNVLKTVYDTDTKIRQQLKKDYPEVRIADNEKEIFKDKAIEAVVVATPAAEHYNLAIAALNAGKHVFVEKPLSLTYADGLSLVNLAREKSKKLFVGHILHYHPAVIRMKEIINKGHIGRLQYIYSRRLSLGKIRREENILWSFAPHDISVILGITKEDPNYIDAVGNNFLHPHIPDVTMSSLKFPSGIGAHIFVSWLNPFKEQRLVVIGSQGMMVFDDTQPVEKKLIYYPNQIYWKDGIPVSEKAEGNAVNLSDIWEEPLKRECRAFLDSIVNNTTPLTSGEEGLRVLKILEACQQAIEQKEQRSFDIKPRTSNVETRTSFFAHPTAIVDEKVKIGKGTRIWHFTHVLSGSKIGENCNIGQNVVIGPDAVIGNKCKIQNNVSVYKGVTLEDGVFCGPSMVFTNIYNPRAEISKMNQVRPTLVKKGATLGANCTIICGNTIGSYALVGAGAVVTKDVPAHALMMGNPAKQKGWVCECGESLNTKLHCTVCKKQFKKTKNGISIKQ
ncbi:MAG: Gfo/Idh/MocA family oxidoreductase [Syntrophaceae bacterium]|nr:Gfo/Idh/MocA family oxidoreductase [Syntrophaceae bacterium]